VMALAVSNADGTPNSVSNPASIGSSVAIYLTGVGQTNPKGVDGGVNPGAGVSPVQMPFISVNSSNGQPSYFGIAPGQSTAVFQLNLQMPAPTDGGNSDIVSIFTNGSTGEAVIHVYVK
jgi:uncharacterized protein (TIGR03437 family)